MTFSNNMALLILDERGSVQDMVDCYARVNGKMIEKYNMNGVTVLTNDEAIEGNEQELHRLAKISFFEDWKTQPVYRQMIRRCLSDEDIYIMRQAGDGWEVREAKEGEYEVLDPDGLTQAKPVYLDD